jgi:hypothetical protein
MGMQTMPVVIKCDIRWSEQQDPERFDYRSVWPQLLMSECGTKQIPFPITRENAMRPYNGTPFETAIEHQEELPQANKKSHQPGM